MDSPENTTVTIYQEGDVTLVCTEADDGSTASRYVDETGAPLPAPTPTRSLIVSSHVLRLSSSVFDRMLAHNMKEGIGLTSKDHVTIPLPDDDAEAMTVICNIVHHRNALVPTEIDANFPHDIAVLLDKYFLSEALKPTVTTWIRDYAADLVKRPTYPEHQNRMRPTTTVAAFQQSHDQWVQSRIDIWTDMLLSAYNLEHHKLAQKAIEYLTLGCDYPEQNFNIEDYPVPNDLLDCVRDAQFDALTYMRKTAKSVMSCLVKHQKKHKPKCEKLIRETKALKKELSRKGLFPWVKRHPCDLEAILVRLESLEIDPVRLAGTDGSNCRLSIGLCECEKAPNPNSMVEKIRTRAAALRVRIENVEIDF